MPRKKRIPLTTGRPVIPIDWIKVDKWLQGHMTAAGIADLLCMSVHTFYDRTLQEKGVPYSEYSRSKKDSGKSLLQYRQFTSAMSGNSTMLKLLGEEWLDQGKKNNNDIENQVDNVIDAVREVEEEQGGHATFRSSMEDESSVLDQDQRGQEDQVPVELGAENPLG